MSEFTGNAKRFVKNLKRRKNVEIASVYEDFKSWDLYYSISGWLSGKYFMIYITKYNKDESFEIVVEHTECVEKFKELAKKYNLIK